MDLTDEKIFKYGLIYLYISAIPNLIVLRFIQAPYGKHKRPGWGPTISPPVAWFLMESPTLWLALLIFPFGIHSSNLKSLTLISPYLIHYFHRTIVYPIRLLKNRNSPGSGSGGFPVSVALMAFCFNMLNAYLQARFVSNYNDDDPNDEWFWWRFCGGLLVFFSGMAVNIWSDYVLVGLKNSGGGYKVPYGGWFDLVSCPNYFGEILEWFGWVIMTWSWTGFGFFVYTCANLIPRARANHIWYLEKFGEDYPKNRKIVIPFLY